MYAGMQASTAITFPERDAASGWCGLSGRWPKILGKLLWDTFLINSPLCLLRVAAESSVGPAEAGAAEQAGPPAVLPPQVPAMSRVTAAEPLPFRLLVATVDLSV